MTEILNAIHQILDFMDQHGTIPVLFVALLFFWFIPWVQSKMKNDKAKVVDEQSQKEEEELKTVEMSIEFDSEISQLLQEVGIRKKAQWTTLWQFHNGTLAMGGIPFVKISATHQYAERGHEPNLDEFKDLSLSMFTDNNRELLHNEVICVDNRDETKNQAIRNAQMAHGIETTYMARILNSKGNIVGVLTVAFTSPCTLTDEDKEKLSESADRMSMIIEKYSLYKDRSKKHA